MRPPEPIDHSCRILIVCTANQSRSPVAAALLAHRMSESFVAGELRSSGTRADAASTATTQAIKVMAERGIDLSSHRSRPLDAESVEEADLVVGMALEHVREVIALVPVAWTRSFTFKELVRRGETRPRCGEALTDWLAMLADSRAVEDLLGDSLLDDVADPIGLALGAHRDTVAELDDLSARLVRVAWPARSENGPTSPEVEPTDGWPKPPRSTRNDQIEASS